MLVRLNSWSKIPTRGTRSFFALYISAVSRSVVNILPFVGPHALSGVRGGALGKGEESLGGVVHQEDGAAGIGDEDRIGDGVEVVVEGKYAESGNFTAGTLLAKCPSKFEST